jgi:hypothetical protein
MKVVITFDLSDQVLAMCKHAGNTLPDQALSVFG